MEQARLKSGHILIAGLLAVGASVGGIVVIVLNSQNAPAASQASVTAAVIALVGTLWTAAVTFVGLLLKDSVDRRNALLQVESEKRLRMETALKAIEIMSAAETEGAPLRESREAAILVVSSLGQLRLALTMGQQFWERDKISSDAFVQVVEQCIEAGEEELARQGSYLLRLSPHRLVESPDQIALPYKLMVSWSSAMPRSIKENLLHAFIGALLSKTYGYWSQGLVNTAIYLMYKVLTQDSEPRFAYSAALFAKELCDLVGYDAESAIFPTDRPPVTIQEINVQAEAVLAKLGTIEDNISDGEYFLLMKMQGWKPAPPAPEASAE